MWKALIFWILASFSLLPWWCDRSWWPSPKGEVVFVAAVAAVVGVHERGDPRQVGLERQRQAGRPSAGCGPCSRCGMPVGRSILFAPTSAAGGALAMRSSSSRTPVRYSSSLRWSLAPSVDLQRLRVLGHEIQDALLVAVAAGGVVVALGGRAEQAVEDQLGVDLLGHRRRFAAPGEVRRVGAAVAGVAVAGVLAALAADLQRGEARGLADGLGRHLVDGNADADVGAVRLAGLPAGEPRRPWRGRGRRGRRRAAGPCPPSGRSEPGSRP